MGFRGECLRYDEHQQCDCDCGVDDLSLDKHRGKQLSETTARGGRTGNISGAPDDATETGE
jgi:hypothetical protein